MQQNLESTEVVTQFTQIQKDLVKVKEIISDEEKVLVIAHHPQQVCVFCSFFLIVYCVFQHNRTFYYGPLYTQNFQSFFYSLLLSLEGAKANRLLKVICVQNCCRLRFFSVYREHEKQSHIQSRIF